MSKPITRAACLTIFFVCTSFAAITVAQPTASTDAPVYKPPLRGAPASRIGGGTRGLSVQAAPTIAVLAPDHTGYTTSAQPTLYWYLSRQTPVKIEVTLLDEAGVKPLVEKTLQSPLPAGIQALSLKELGVTLTPGVEYRWHVALVNDPKQRSGDVTSSGTVRVVPVPDALKSRLAQTPAAGRASVFAEEGMWYDAIEALVQRINAAPGDQGLRDQLNGLLAQVGLARIAPQP
jgi:hypothetical protein